MIIRFGVKFRLLSYSTVRKEDQNYVCPGHWKPLMRFHKLLSAIPLQIYLQPLFERKKRCHLVWPKEAKHWNLSHSQCDSIFFFFLQVSRQFNFSVCATHHTHMFYVWWNTVVCLFVFFFSSAFIAHVKHTVCIIILCVGRFQFVSRKKKKKENKYNFAADRWTVRRIMRAWNG